MSDTILWVLDGFLALALVVLVVRDCRHTWRQRQQAPVDWWI